MFKESEIIEGIEITLKIFKGFFNCITIQLMMVYIVLKPCPNEKWYNRIQQQVYAYFAYLKTFENKRLLQHLEEMCK